VDAAAGLGLVPIDLRLPANQHGGAPHRDVLRRSDGIRDGVALTGGRQIVDQHSRRTADDHAGAVRRDWQRDRDSKEPRGRWDR